MKLFVTGGAGFIGSNFVRLFLRERPKDSLVNFDALTYAGNLGNLDGLEKDPRHTFIKGDIRDLVAVRTAMKGCDAVINFAAESHVDRSIENPGIFVDTNVLGTQVLLTAARDHRISRFLQVSTDEVYGSLGPTGFFTEATALQPNSPYSASKAGADCLVRAAFHTHNLSTLITRCSNNYGPYQFPEKLIPLFISNALEGRPLPLYGDGGNVRDWLFVDDHNDALLAVLERGRPGEVYNIGGNNEMTNRTITLEILRQLGKPESLIKLVTDRPGHDRRYAIDAGKIRRELGWEPHTSFIDGLAATIRWYREHGDWWAGIRSGAYLAYYERMYGKRLAT